MTKVTGRFPDLWAEPGVARGTWAPTGSFVQLDDLYRCPDCDSDGLVVTDEDSFGQFVCLDCGRCWRVERAGASAVDPATCPGCVYQGHCRLLRGPTGAGFGKGREA